MAAAFSTSSLSWGAAVDNGASIDESCHIYRPQYVGGTTSRVGSHSANDMCGGWCGNDGVPLGEISCTDMASGSFEITNNVGTTAHAFGYLALELEDTPALFNVTTPTDGNEWDPYTDTLKRDAVVGLVSSAGALNTNYSAAPDAASVGHYVVDSDGNEDGAVAYSEEEVGTSNTSGRHSAALIVQDAQGTPDFTASAPTFDADGLVFDAANVSAATNAFQVIFIAMGQAAQEPGEQASIVVPTPQRNRRKSGRWL